MPCLLVLFSILFPIVLMLPVNIAAQTVKEYKHTLVYGLCDADCTGYGQYYGRVFNADKG